MVQEPFTSSGIEELEPDEIDEYSYGETHHVTAQADRDQKSLSTEQYTLCDSLITSDNIRRLLLPFTPDDV